MATTTATMTATASEAISQVLNELTKGTFGVTLITLTAPGMNKKHNPYYGRVYKATYLANVAIGYGYENTINSRLEKEGKEPEFESGHLKGYRWSKGMYGLLLESKTNPEQKYLRITMRKNTTKKVVYILDGKIATTEEVADIMPYLKDTTPNTSNQGLSKGNEVIIKNYKVEAILSLQQGEKSYQASSDVSFAELKAYFS